VTDVSAWQTFIRAAEPSDHAVQIYDDLGALQRVVCSFVGAGFEAGAPAVVIATDEHRRSFDRGLAAGGWDLAGIRAEGLLDVLDAEETLSLVMHEESPDPDAFARVVGGLIDDAAARFPGSTVRAYGEMVDLLWRRGLQAAAIDLEKLWNELAATREFALLCAYRLDIFEPDVQARGLPEIFGVHTHARPATDPAGLAAAVDRALTDCVGPVETARIYLAVAEQVPRDASRGQAVLAWLSANRTDVAERVLERLRTPRLGSAPA